jgi:SAM-dependent methyltransferase
MLEESRDRILARLGDEDLVLDVGGWGKPFARADWVIDLQPYETRGLYGYDQGQRHTERFTKATWVVRDICDHEPWPFDDDQFDFVICSHTLEDIRDPVWVCKELQRVGKAGYIEVPSRLEEQTVGVNGPWPGWAHHRWLCNIEENGIEFIHKSHALRLGGESTVAASYTLSRPMRERRSILRWNGSFSCGERVVMTAEEMDACLASGVPDGAPAPRNSALGALVRRLRSRAQ